jgi:hypothetical protein
MNVESIALLGILSFIFQLSLLITSLILLVILYVKTSRIEISNSEQFRSIHDTLDRISSDVGVDSFVKSMEDRSYQEGFPAGPRWAGNMTFKSMDGKYQAASMPELLKKMIDDPNSGFNSQQIEDLKKLFERLVGETPDQDFDRNDEEDDPDSWRSKDR